MWVEPNDTVQEITKKVVAAMVTKKKRKERRERVADAHRQRVDAWVQDLKPIALSHPLRAFFLYHMRKHVYRLDDRNGVWMVAGTLGIGAVEALDMADRKFKAFIQVPNDEVSQVLVLHVEDLEVLSQKPNLPF